VANMKLKNQQLVLLKPSTFMNFSGNAVRYWLQKENISVENLLVVVDDLSLELGALRIKGKGSAGGHNGLKNIQELIGTENYARLRFGIGNDFPRGGQIDFVLSKFPEEKEKLLKERITVACDMIKSFCLAGLDNTMNLFNKK
jgi:PTH1 family peptidyl-tRNA hydrolase